MTKWELKNIQYAKLLPIFKKNTSAIVKVKFWIDFLKEKYLVIRENNDKRLPTILVLINDINEVSYSFK